jgi:hypothetical protein
MAIMTSLTKKPNRRVLVYGPPKVGKTYAVAGLAKEHKLHWLDLEQGSTTLFQFPPEIQANINLIRITDTEDDPCAIKSMSSFVQGASLRVCAEHGTPECPICKKANKMFDVLDPKTIGPSDIIVCDSLTQLVASAMNKVAFGKSTDYKFEFDDWRRLGMYMDNFLSYIQSGKHNWVCISHETVVDANENSKEKKIVPVAGTGNFSRNSGKYFTDVIYARIFNMKHSLSSVAVANPSVIQSSATSIDLSKEPDGLLALFR